jgi:hypothetical protein
MKKLLGSRSATRGTTRREPVGGKTWKELRDEESEELGYGTFSRTRDHRWRPGGHRARRATATLGVPTIIVESNERAGGLLAQALQVALPARSGLVRPPAVHRLSPNELARVLAKGQDRRLARDVHEGDGARLLGLEHRRRRRATTRRCRSGSSSSIAMATEVTLRPSTSSSPLACRATRSCREIHRAWTFDGRAAPLLASTPGPIRRTGARRPSCRLQQLRPRHLRGALGARVPMSRWCSGRPRTWRRRTR